MSNNYQKFLGTYTGKALLQKHSLTETGLWRIRGEDPNCDMGGSHIMPDLGFAEGTLQAAIEFAVELPSFWGWGAGGDLTKVQSIKLDTNILKRITFLRAERTSLHKQIEKINAELHTLGAE